MKRTLLVPVALFLHMIVYAVVIGVPVFFLGLEGSAIVGHLGLVLFAAMTVAVPAVSVRSVFRPIVPVVFLLMLIFATAAFTLGIVVLDTVVLDRHTRDPGTERGIPVGAILTGPEFSLFVGDATGVALEDVLVFRTGEVPRIMRFENAVWNSRAQEIVSTDPDTPGRFAAAELDTVSWRRVPPSIRRVVDDLATVYALPAGSFRLGNTRDLAIYLGSLVLALTAVWTPARLFRWPMLNVLLAIGYLRGVLWVPSGVVAYSMIERLPDWVPTLFGEYLTATIWIVSAMILFGIALVLPSLARWRREIGSEVSVA
ncbi:MAG: hypothetical protein ACLFR8_08515 [Alkalispirochaeta sp.]